MKIQAVAIIVVVVLAGGAPAEADLMTSALLVEKTELVITCRDHWAKLRFSQRSDTGEVRLEALNSKPSVSAAGLAEAKRFLHRFQGLDFSLTGCSGRGLTINMRSRWKDAAGKPTFAGALSITPGTLVAHDTTAFLP